MKNQINDLQEWFRKQPRWIREAGHRLIENGQLSSADIDELLDICVDRSLTPTVPAKLAISKLSSPEGDEAFRLLEISNVSGINALSPTRPLNFGVESLCIVFGRNGAGKSGYVRLLKNACGARTGEEVLGNVYSPAGSPQTATVSIQDDGETESFEWTGQTIPELRSVDIYDTECGLLYVDEENEVSYEPALLRLFSQLSAACAVVRDAIDTRIASKSSAKPGMPTEYALTTASSWYSELTHKTSKEEISANTDWEYQNEERLRQVEKRLAEDDPSKKSAELRKRAGLTDALLADLRLLATRLDEKNCQALLEQKKRFTKTRKAADEDAASVFSGAPLAGVGTDSWLLLWAAARRYAEEEAYSDLSFPNTEPGACCVLCQRELDEDSGARIRSFETFVRGDLRKSADEAEKELARTIEELPDIPTAEVVDAKLEATGISDPEMKGCVQQYIDSLSKRKAASLKEGNLDSIPILPAETLVSFLENISKKMREDANVYDEDAKGANRLVLVEERLGLKARQWLKQQKSSVEAEVKRLAQIEALRMARQQTDTTSLSVRKSQLAEQMITQAYVKRFQDELASLNASHIPVDIVKTKVSYGHAYHQIQLRNVGQLAKVTRVLSEGEFRIVSLAAFLADTEGRNARTPFIFDDPISSLDHVYEAAAAKRLVRLSAVRQVLVFTHRLSLVGFLQKYAQKSNVKSTLIALSQYCIGETTELPIDLGATHKSVNALLNERLSRARKALSEGDMAYQHEAKGLCRDIRVLIERVVEKDLINEVVKRFSPEVNTKGRIGALSEITADQCTMIDDYMTKYSQYEHSQPDETPLQFPLPDELEQDLQALQKLIQELRTRNS